MSITIVGPPEIEIPFEQARPIIERKAVWEDEWKVDPTLVPISADIASASAGIGAMHMRREYGAVKRVYQDDFGDSESIDIDRHWVRLRFSYQDGDDVVWVGRVSTEIREIEGGETSHDSDEIPAGGQVWAAYGPLDQLRKISVSRSWWWHEDEDMENGGELRIMGWIPAMNIRDHQGMLYGNRSEEKHNKAFMFGGTRQWTRKTFIEHLLDRHANINQGAGTNPQWSLGGQTDALEQLFDQIDFGDRMSLLDMLQTLIAPTIGLDFRVDPTDDGFEIVVFALSDYTYGFNGAAVPKNPDQIRVDVSDTNSYRRPTINLSNDHKHTKIRIIGARIIIVKSLRGPEAPKVGDGVSLVGKWDATLETQYESGAGAKDFSTEQLDAARMRDKYRMVYQRFGAPEEYGIPAPSLDAYGEITGGDQEYQTTVRNTMRETKLIEGYDYTQDPPVDNNPDDTLPDFLPPQVWLKDPLLDIYESSEAIPVQELVPLEHDWGVFLQMELNHLIAKNHFTAVNDSGLDPYYDYDTMIATIAVESDQRLQIEWQLYPDDDLEDYSIHEIEMPEAQMWVLAPDTVVEIGTDEYGNKGVPIDSGPKWRVLRSDVDQMNYMMAAEIARYHTARALARIPCRLLLPWQNNIGKILMQVEDKGDLQELRAPVTRVEWTFGDEFGTTMYAGFAQ